MAHWSDDCTWLLFTLTVSSSAVLASSFAPHGTCWQDCSTEEPFLTLWNINLDDCVYECHVRRLCKAVNYNKMTKGCALLTMDKMVSPELYPEMTRQQSCVFVPKNISSLAWVIDACQNCDNASVCDAASGNCSIKECRKLHVENAIIKGNMLVVGSKAIVECLDWYTLDRSNPQVVCQANGTWGDTPRCVPGAACGVPPDVTNAEAVTFNSITSHAEYVCLDGYSTLGTAINTVLKCRGDNTWADVNFTCLTCGPPLFFPNAEAVDVNAVANGIDYACLSGAVAPSNQNDMTLVCGGNSVWEAPGFTCIRVCATDWVYIGTSCYYTPGPATTMIHFEARKYCSAMDAYLLQLETQNESDAVKDYLLATYGAADWWIGLSDLDVDGDWVWAESGTTSTFYDWIIPPDKGRSANFAVIDNTVGWKETDRAHPSVPVCEKM